MTSLAIVGDNALDFVSVTQVEGVTGGGHPVQILFVVVVASLHPHDVRWNQEQGEYTREADMVQHGKGYGVSF